MDLFFLNRDDFYFKSYTLKVKENLFKLIIVLKGNRLPHLPRYLKKSSSLTSMLVFSPVYNSMQKLFAVVTEVKHSDDLSTG